ncbi:MAG TPA: hypothetical protein VF256_12055, partial [Streptosporangiaceae bacterium]
MTSAAGSAARRQPSQQGQGSRASAQQASGRTGSDEVSRPDAPVALVDPNLSVGAAAGSSPARG